MPHQPLRRAVPSQDDVFVGQSFQAGQLHSWESEVPDVDYEDINPFSAMAMQRFPVCTNNHSYTRSGGFCFVFTGGGFKELSA